MKKLNLQDGRLVSKADYVKAKTGDLKNYGYISLTESSLEEQVDKILAGEKLDIIGMFCESDIDVEATNKQQP